MSYISKLKILLPLKYVQTCAIRIHFNEQVKKKNQVFQQKLMVEKIIREELYIYMRCRSIKHRTFNFFFFFFFTPRICIPRVPLLLMTSREEQQGGGGSLNSGGNEKFR